MLAVLDIGSIQLVMTYAAELQVRTGHETFFI